MHEVIKADCTVWPMEAYEQMQTGRRMHSLTELQVFLEDHPDLLTCLRTMWSGAPPSLTG